jgi:citrate synthase
MQNKVTPKGSAQLTVNGQTHELPVFAGSVGPDVIDIRTLYKDTGMFTFDPGFTSTASANPRSPYIDGDEGTLLHRGYPIDQLADMATSSKSAICCFTASCHTTQKEDFDYRVTRHTMLHEQMTGSSPASAAMRTRWRSCAAPSARCRRSITTQPTSMTRISAWSPHAHDRENADIAADGLQVFDRSALRVSAQ